LKIKKNIDFFNLIRSFNLLKRTDENVSFLKISRKKQEEILNFIRQNLPKNLDYINRSFAQYKCQMWFYKKINKIILNICSISVFFPILIFLLLNGYFLLFLNKCELFFSKSNQRKLNIAIFFGCNENTIPKSLNKYYKSIIRIDPNFALDLKTLIFLINKLYSKFYYYPYFCLKNTIKISLYNANIIINQPKAFIETFEYSFTSSILTYYCEINNCKHINIMHGEKLFNIRDSFFKFHKCYVWHKHYVDLFEKLGADKNQFIIELPSFFNIKQFNSIKDMGKKDIFKYYLSGKETQKQLYQLYEVLNILSNNFDIVIRPHPIWSKKNSANNFFKNLEVENPNNVSIIDSLLSADYICALYSTVLFQGYCMNKKIVVNDLDKAIYEKLKELDFIIVSLPHTLLSLLLSEVNINQ